MGPLQGVRVLELAGLGAAPFGCMLLADLGAEVVRVERVGPAADAARRYVPHRGRRSIALDLKDASGRETLLRLVARADVLVEAYRPGVAERLGVGPDDCLRRNPRLVYARMTGWGQTGPLAHTAGHDINYIAVAGALDNFRRTGERPLPPVNLVGDMGGGGMLLAFGIAAALVHVGRTGQGQVVDAAMIDGAALQLATLFGMRAQGRWPNPPGGNAFDTGAPSYEVYECADGRHVAVGAIEEPFWAEFLRLLDLPDGLLPSRRDPANWPTAKRVLADTFRTRTRAQWTELFDGTDACVSPVLSLDEAPTHPHATARGTFVEIDGVVQPSPAPRFSRTPAGPPTPPPMPGADTEQVLREWGVPLSEPGSRQPIKEETVSRVSFGDITREHRRSFPDRPALVDGETRLTWPELDDRTNRAAHALAAAGVRAGDRVLWLGQTSFRVFELLGACAKLGAMVCPANWRQSADELAFVISDFDPKIVVWQDEEIGEAVRAAREHAGHGATWWQHDADGPDTYEGVLGAADRTDVWGPVDADLPLLVIYTAAIAGRPNGSLVTQRNLLAMGTESAYLTSTTSDSVFLNSGPLFHIGNFQWDAVATFLMGGTNVFVRRADPRQLLEIIATERVTSAFLMPPTIFAMKALHAEGGHDLSSLRGGPFTPLWDGIIIGADTTLWGTRPGGFGQTEVTGLAVFNAHGGRGLGNSGRPGPLTRVRIVDADWRELPVGEPGEIVIGGETVHAGYWNRPEINARRMRDGWWRTTDLGRREPDGTVHFIGTMTRMIKSAAENIYPAEVEACLERHPAVREAALIGVPDPEFVQSAKAVVALVDGARVTAEELIAHCREHIASYKKPRAVEFVDALPRIDGAKDYAALDDKFGGGGYPGSDNV